MEKQRIIEATLKKIRVKRCGKNKKKNKKESTFLFYSNFN